MKREKLCRVSSCIRPQLSQGMCNTHYSQWYYGREFSSLPDINIPQCIFEGCFDPARIKGLCSGHNSQRVRGEELRPKRPKARFRGEGHINKEGYKIISCPDKNHKNAWKNGAILEHTWVMSEHLGRSLTTGENVHHINGIKDDNRIENLELWITSQPSGQRVEDKVAWAWELINLYDPEEKLRPMT